METQTQPRVEETTHHGFLRRPIWLFFLLGLMAWQGWMTLTLFGTERPWQLLLDQQPILSGHHPLHLYHGYLGARSIWWHGTACCYDPAFQAGYPKTPVFDSGSRPAELFLSLVGGTYQPQAYKIGLAICCLLVPVVVALAARCVGLGAGGSCLAGAVGMAIWWGNPCRQALEAGDLDLLMASLLALAHVGLLVQFDRHPGPSFWAGLLATGALGWFAHPIFFAILLPIYLTYYLNVGHRHGLGWHMLLLLALAAGLGANAFWLPDFATHCWIRSPWPVTDQLLTHRTFQTLWTASFWGEPADRALAMGLLALGTIGLVILHQTRYRPGARLLATAGVLCLALALVGIAWEPLGRFGTPRLLAPALWFAVVPTVHTLVCASTWLAKQTRCAWRAGLAIGAVIVIAGLAAHEHVATFLRRCDQVTPLAVGLGPERQTLVAELIQHTSRDARILWEDRPDGGQGVRWTALLPLLTDRIYLGGLGCDACVDHAYPSFAGQDLAGRSLTSWNNEELEQFCERYNVGWVVCWSPAAVARFNHWKEKAEPVVLLRDGVPGCLYRLRRSPSYILEGQARWLSADCQRIALADVVPSKDGKVVLSLHYQSGMQVLPRRVQVEREPDPRDPIPLIRLRMTGPVTRLTLTWEDP